MITPILMNTIVAPFLAFVIFIIGWNTLGPGKTIQSQYENRTVSNESISEDYSNTYQNPVLLAILQEIQPKSGYNDLSLKWTDDPITDCGWVESAGCYVGEGNSHTIYILNNSPEKTVKNTMAHEYLHYVWYKENLESKGNLVSLLENFYASSPTLRQRIDPYYTKDGNALEATEIFSYSCTEINDGSLGEIATWCNKYIDTQSVPVLLY